MTATRRRRRLVWSVGGAIGVAIAVVAAGGAIAAVHATDGADRYRTATAAMGDVAQVVTLTGSVQRLGDTSVSFPAAGTVTAVDVQVGQSVAQGQTLAALDPAPLQSALLAAQAQLAGDEVTLESAQTSTGAGTGSSGSTAASTASGSGSSDAGGALTAAISAMDAAVKGEQAACASLLTPASSAGGTSRASSPTPSPSPTPASSPSPTSSPAPASSPAPTPSPSSSPTPSASPSPDPSPSPSPSTSPGGGASGSSGGGAAAPGGLPACANAISQASGAISRAAAVIVETASHGTSTSSAGRGAAAGSGGAGGAGTSATSGDAGASRAASAAVAVLQDQSNVSIAQENLAGATLVAPVAGVVAAVPFSTGETAATSASIQIAGAGSADVTVDVPAADMPLVTAGSAAQVTPDGAQTALAGTIASVGLLPASSSSSAPSYPAVVTVSNPPVSLATGSQAVVAVTVDSASNVLRVPVSAVTGRTGSAASVTVLDDTGAASTVAVELGAVGGGWAEVRNGLQAGQRVVLADTQAALPGNSATSGRFGSGGGLGGGSATSGRGGSGARAGG